MQQQPVHSSSRFDKVREVTPADRVREAPANLRLVPPRSANQPMQMQAEQPATTYTTSMK